jgi:hypothetical protein
MGQFQQQPNNGLQPLGDRVAEYRQATPNPGRHNHHHHHHPRHDGTNPEEEHPRQMADHIAAWSAEWERLERERTGR